MSWVLSVSRRGVLLHLSIYNFKSHKLKSTTKGFVLFCRRIEREEKREKRKKRELGRNANGNGTMNQV